MLNLNRKQILKAVFLGLILLFLLCVAIYRIDTNIVVCDSYFGMAEENHWYDVYVNTSIELYHGTDSNYWVIAIYPIGLIPFAIIYTMYIVIGILLDSPILAILLSLLIVMLLDTLIFGNNLFLCLGCIFDLICII